MDKISVVGLNIKSGNLSLKPLKKSHYKSFVEFSKEYDGKSVSLEEFLELYSSKEFAFFQTGKLWLYLFENKTGNKFESGEIIGYAEITPTECENTAENQNTAEIGYFVKNTVREQGYAKKMLALAIETCKNMEYERVVAKTNKSNAPSISVLKSQNFQITQDGEFFSAVLNLK